MAEHRRSIEGLESDENKKTETCSSEHPILIAGDMSYEVNLVNLGTMPEPEAEVSLGQEYIEIPLGRSRTLRVHRKPTCFCSQELNTEAEYQVAIESAPGEETAFQIALWYHHRRLPECEYGAVIWALQDVEKWARQ